MLIFIYIYRINQIGNESAKLTSMKGKQKTLFLVSFHFIKIHSSIYIALSKIKNHGFGFSFSFDPL